ncbi:MAG TPA: hypothetical protein VJM83_01775 [Nitrospirota bacterium]|nr:hypothetical protein [Nitrospirota bacterium]
MKLDLFDMVVIACASALFAGAVFFAAFGGRAATGAPNARASASKPGPDLYPKLAEAKAMIDAGQAKEAADSLKLVAAQNPTVAEAHALLGQAYSRLLDYKGSVREYRLALSLDADYVDKKSEKFIGKRIKAAVKEAKPVFASTLEAKPDDQCAEAALNDCRYLERMLAGGCE